VSEQGLRETIAWLNGVYIAAAAVSDAVLAVDGPYCVVYRAEMHAAHDLRTTLLRPDSTGRLVHTDVQVGTEAVVDRAALARGKDIVDVLGHAAALPGAGIVLLTSMDFHVLLAAPLERYRRAAARSGGAPILLVESESLDSNWLGGYAATMARIAQDLDLGAPAPEPGTVAVIGHFMDRQEGDQIGNLAEISRLLGGLGLDVASIWFDGGSVTDLRAVGRASLLVSLPHGRKASEVLAERLGVPQVQVELPLGVARTARFVRAVARAAGRGARGEALIDAELRPLVRDIQPQVFRFLAGRKIEIHADPHAAAALCELADELGMVCGRVVVLGEAGDAEPADRERLTIGGAHWQPLMRVHPDAASAPDCDALISPTLFPCRPGRPGWIAFGYPNYVSHPLLPQPFLGFGGVRWWVERLTQACQHAEIHDEWRRSDAARLPPGDDA